MQIFIFGRTAAIVRMARKITVFGDCSGAVVDASLTEHSSRDALQLRKLADAPNFPNCIVDQRIETKETSA